MNVTCSAPVCPVILNSSCVFYEGESLVYTGINTNDSLQVALQKIDAALGVTTVVNIYNSDGVLTGNRTVSMNSFSLSFEKDVYVHGVRVGRGGGSIGTNTVVGDSSLVNNTTGTFNTAVGIGALDNNTVGNYNTGIGAYSLTNVSSGEGNTGVGTSSMTFLTTGYSNTALGYGALYNATTGFQNIGVGRSSLYNLTSGSENIGIGLSTGSSITTGIRNTIVGHISGQSLSTGNSNTIIGANVSGLAPTTSNNIILSDGDGNIQFKDDGANTILPRLAGAGTRMVVADVSGALSSQAIPTGNITGSGANGQVAYWTGASTQAGSNNLFYDAANARLGVGTNILTASTKLTVSGSETASSGIARGVLINTSLTDSANLNNLVALDVAPTFISGGFATITNIGIRSSVSGGTAQTPTWAAQFINNTNAFGNHGVLIQNSQTSDSTSALLVQAGGANNTFSIRGNRYLWYNGGNAYFGNFANAGARVHVRGGATEPTLIAEDSAGVSSLQVFANRNITINSSTDLGVRLGVVGDTLLLGSGATSATTALTVQNSSSTNLFTVRNDGNVGVGVDPSSWASSFRVLQIGSSGSSLFGRTGSTVQVGIGTNMYFNGTNYIRIQSGTSTLYVQSLGVHYWQTAVTGAAGSTITYTDTMTLDNAGNLGIGTTPTALTDIGASTTARASLRLREGVAPTTPNNGDIWSTTTDLLARIGGTTYSLINSGLSGSGTAGQVTFWSSASGLTGSNNLFWDNANSRLGIGTNTPTAKLEVTNSEFVAIGATSHGELINASQTASAGVGGAIKNGLRIVGSGTFDRNVGTEVYGLNIPAYSGTVYNNNVLGAYIQDRVAIGSFNPVAQAVPSSLTIANAVDYTTYNANANTIFLRHNSGATAGLIAGIYGSTTPVNVQAGVFFTRGANTGSGLIDFVNANSNVAGTLKMRLYGTGNLVIQDSGTFSDAGFRLDVNGTARVVGLVSLQAGLTSTGGLLTQNTGANSGRMSLLNLRNTGGGYDSAVNSSVAIAFTNRLIAGNWSDDFIELKVYNNGASTSTTGYNFYTHNNQSTTANSVLAMSINGQSVGVGVETPNASAKVQIDSTSQGFLPPRMTVAQRTAIVSPAEGLIVFQTDGVIGLYVYANAAWRSLTMV